MKICPKYTKFAKVGSKFCPIVNGPLEKLPKILPKWGNFAKPGHTGHHPTRPNLQIKRKNCPNRRKEEKIKERNEMIIAGETEIEI